MNRIVSHAILPLVLGALSALLLARALGGGFQLDDHFQRAKLLGFDPPSIQLFVFYDGDPEANRAQIEKGFLPWWSAEQLRHANFRYLSVLTMQLDYLLWPNQPWLMHLHSLLWLAALVSVAVLLYRQIHGAGAVSALAGLLYALDDAHSLPTAYLANRNALLATAFGTLAILCLVRTMQSQPDKSDLTGRPPWWLGPLCLALALASGEIGLCTLAYLVSASLFLDTSPIPRRVRTLAPYLAVTALWAAIYKVFNFGSSASGFYVDPLASPTEFLSLVASRGLLLLMGQWSPIPADLGSALAPGSTEMSFLLAIGAATSILLAIVLTPLLARSREARFWACGSILALCPVIATGPQNRLLFFVGIGAMALLAQLVQSAFSKTEQASYSGVRSLAIQAVAALLLLVHLAGGPALSQIFLATNEQANARMVRAIESAPQDSAISRQDLILINPPDPIYLVTSIPMSRFARGIPSPKRLRHLFNGKSNATVFREDERTLRVELESSLFPDSFSRYHRSTALSFRLNDTIATSGFRAVILSLDDNGDPNELRFRFDVPLEDESLRWVVFEDGAYHDWLPPAVGDQESLSAQPGIFDF